MKKIHSKLYNLIISAAAIAAMWLVWLIAFFCVGNDYVVPSVGDTINEMFALFASSSYWLAFGMTMARTVLSFVIACILSAALAACSVAFSGARSFIQPFVNFFRTLPVMAVTLMLLIWTSRAVAPVIVCILTLGPITYAQFMAAYDGIDRGLLEMARVYRLSRTKCIFSICIPQMMPPVFSQAGADISLALKVTVSAEVLSSTFHSMGNLINDASLFLNTAEMFALTLTVLIAGGIVEWLFGNLRRIPARWAVKEGADVD